MAQPIVTAQQSAIPSFRNGQILKIKDLQVESNLKNNIDIIAVIAKIGEMKLANTPTARGSVVSVPAREIYLCDDSWAMIKLIVRDSFAKNSDSYKSDQVLYVRNVKPMKLRGYTVLATTSETLLNQESNTPEAISLRCWLAQNNLEFKQDGLKDVLFKRFTNLSSKNDSNSPAGSLENLNKESQLSQFSQSSVVLSQSNDTEDNKNTVNINGTERKRTRSNINREEAVDINIKVIKLDLTPNSSKLNGADSSALSDFATQKAYVNTLEKKPIAKESEAVINIDSGDESTEKQNVKKTIKKEVLEKEDSGIEVIDDDKDFIISETYNALMSGQRQLKNWNTEKDKYLINFLSKHCTKQLTYDMCLKLFEANLNIFQGLSAEELKSRAEILASAKNYLYLLQLCGGKEIKTEKEKCIFIDQVEQLRRLMRSKEIKEEYSIY